MPSLGASIILAVEGKALSIRRLTQVTGSYYKAVVSELKALNEAGWVKEVKNSSGPQRTHVLTKDGQRLCSALKAVVEILQTKSGGME